MITTVRLAPRVTKALRKLPSHIVDKLRAWVRGVETFGLDTIKTTKGFHDEPLHGEREGQRSIRLSKSYRAIYVIERDEVKVEFVKVTEVHKHDY
jgi:proteic killer suppression protein